MHCIDVKETQEECTPVVFVSERIKDIGDQYHWSCDTITWLQHSMCLVPTQGDIGCKGQAKLPQRRTQALVDNQASAVLSTGKGLGPSLATISCNCCAAAVSRGFKKSNA